MIAGVIELQMMADLAQLRQDMDRAVGYVGTATSKMESLMSGAMKVIGGLGLGLSVGAIGAWAEKVVDAAGSLHDLATRTGAAVEELSRFQEIGRTSSTSAEAIAGAMDKLAKNTALVDDEGKLAAVALRGMGLDFDVFKKMKPDEQMLAVAKALNEYEDGAAKSAVAMGLFGKEGGKLLPFLKDLATDTSTSARVTKEQAENADALADKFIAWKSRAEGVAASYVLDLLPALDKMTGLIVPLIETTGLYFGLFYGVPALFLAAKAAFDAAMVAIAGMGTAAATATTQMGLLAAAAGVVVSAFAGWQIGSWLRENFVEAQLAGIAFVEGTLLGWEKIKLGAGSAWAVIESAWGNTLSGMGGVLSGFLRGLASGLSSLGLDSAAEKVLAWSGKVSDATKNSGDLATKLGALRGEYDKAAGKIRDTTGDMAAYAVESFKNKDVNEKTGKSAQELAAQVDAARRAMKDKEAADKLAEAAAKSHKAELEKQDAAYLSLKGKIEGVIAKMEAEQEQGSKLSEAQKIAMEVTKAVKDGVMGVSAARQAEIEKMVAQMLEIDRVKAAAKLEAEQLKAAREERERATEQVWKHADQLDKEAVKIEEENLAIGRTKEELGKLRLQRLEEELRVAQAIVDKDKLLGYCSDETAAHEATLDALKRLHAATEDKIYLQAANAASEAWKKSAEQIEQGLTDSLFRAFESGKGFWSTLWSGIVNTFKTTILQPIIKDVLSPFAQAWRGIANWISSTVLTPTMNIITSGLGLGSFTGTASAGTSAAGGAGGLGSLASLGSTIAGSLGALGSGASAGFALGAEGIGASLSMIGSASGATSLAGGIGQLIGSAGPYALAAVAALAIANKLFGSKGGPKVEGMASTGNFAGIPGGGSANAEAATILGNVQSLYTGTTSALGGTAGAFTGAAFLARDPNGTALTQLVLDAAINGKQVYSRNNRTGGGNVEDVGRDPQQFADAVAAAQTQALLASLKATTFADADVTAALAAIDANASAADISGRIQSIVQAKAAKDAQAAAAAGPAPGTGVGTAGDYMGPGVMSTISPTQYDDGVASVRTAVDSLKAEVASLRADNTAENTSMAVLLKTLERILVRVSGGADNPGDALSVRAITP